MAKSRRARCSITGLGSPSTNNLRPAPQAAARHAFVAGVLPRAASHAEMAGRAFASAPGGAVLRRNSRLRRTAVVRSPRQWLAPTPSSVSSSRGSAAHARGQGQSGRCANADLTSARSSLDGRSFAMRRHACVQVDWWDAASDRAMATAALYSRAPLDSSSSAGNLSQMRHAAEHPLEPSQPLSALRLVCWHVDRLRRA
jgi:hypothetical protein